MGIRQLSSRLTLVLAVVVTAACSSAPAQERSTGESAREIETASGAAENLSRENLSRIAEVQRATARFHSLDVAIAEGYGAQQPEGCMESPAGGQGFHYLNTALVDGGVELLRPELVMYERQADGSLQLVGVDYIIPFDQWKGDEPPTLLGQRLGRNETLGVWALHIWAWRANPNGTFAAWNPTVSCANANAG